MNEITGITTRDTVATWMSTRDTRYSGNFLDTVTLNYTDYNFLAEIKVKSVTYCR